MANLFSILNPFARTAKVVQPPSESKVQRLRSHLLNLDPEQIGLTPENYANEVWGLLFEWGEEDSRFTLVVLADGTTSLYGPEDPMVIGAGQRQKVKESSIKFLQTANRYVKFATPIESYPHTDNDDTSFYFLGFNSVQAYSENEDSLASHRHKFSELFFAAHEVIYEIRIIYQSQSNS